MIIFIISIFIISTTFVGLLNNLLLILGLLALSNGNVSLFGNKDKNVSNESLKIDKKDTKKLVQKTNKSSRDNENRNNKNNQSRKLSSSLNSNTKKIKKIKKIRKNSKHKNLSSFSYLLPFPQILFSSLEILLEFL